MRLRKVIIMMATTLIMMVMMMIMKTSEFKERGENRNLTKKVFNLHSKKSIKTRTKKQTNRFDCRSQEKNEIKKN